jgi:hypothetical protein
VLKELVEYLIHLEPRREDRGDLTYLDRAMVPLGKGELPTAVKVNTLHGLVDLMNAHVEKFDPDSVIVHIQSHAYVAVIDRVCTPYGVRLMYVGASFEPPGPFPFGRYQDPETFIINLQTLFEPTPDQVYVLSLASNLTAERLTTSEDDGVSQRAGVKKGVTLKTIEKIRPVVSLAPYRTFHEVDAQPASKFLLRLKEAGDEVPPHLALFEADGGAWKIEAMEKIEEYLKVALSARGFTGVPIVY